MKQEKNIENKIINSDQLSQVLDRIVAWIENCDTKTTIILGGLGVVASLFLISDYVKKIIEIFQYMISCLSLWTGLYLLLSSISVLLMIAGLAYLLRVLIPKTNSLTFKNREVISDSLVFFSSIAKNNSFLIYKEKLESCSEERFLDEIASQIYVCSVICDNKFRSYRIGLYLSVIGLLLFALMITIGVIII